MIIDNNTTVEEVITDKSKDFAEQFIEKLKNDELKKDICPQVDKGFNLTNGTIENELKKYNELLDSGILDSATKDCRTCGNMSCRVEQNEKPVDGCIGYINYEHNKKGKQLVKK